MTVTQKHSSTEHKDTQKTSTGSVTTMAPQHTEQTHRDGLQLYSECIEGQISGTQRAREALAAHSYKEQHNNNDAGKQ